MILKIFSSKRVDDTLLFGFIWWVNFTKVLYATMWRTMFPHLPKSHIQMELETNWFQIDWFERILYLNIICWVNELLLDLCVCSTVQPIKCVHSLFYIVLLWSYHLLLTYWGQVKICISKLTIISSDNGLLPGQCQAIFLIKAGILLILFIRTLETNFNVSNFNASIVQAMGQQGAFSECRCYSCSS